MKPVGANTYSKLHRFFGSLCLLFCMSTMLPALALGQGGSASDDVKIELPSLEDAESVVPAIKILGLLTILTVAPAVLLMMTSFTRILIVLGFVRQALGTQGMPPNQIILGLSLFLTFFTMQPVIEQVYEKAYLPYAEKAVDAQTAFEEFTNPVRKFMLAQTREPDLAIFFSVAKVGKPKTSADVPMTVLIPAFMISEIKTAFQIGFLIYIPFLIIDMVIAAILMAMGMMMLPPTVISLPFKIVLFVLVDGWSMIVGSLVKSFTPV
jgi:flagellar biosynthesis protein FliP